MYNIYLKLSKLRKKSSPWITYICRHDTGKAFVGTSQEQQPCRKARHTIEADHSYDLNQKREISKNLLPIKSGMHASFYTCKKNGTVKEKNCKLN